LKWQKAMPVAAAATELDLSVELARTLDSLHPSRIAYKDIK
jgi:hypothetical protein